MEACYISLYNWLFFPMILLLPYSLDLHQAFFQYPRKFIFSCIHFSRYDFVVTLGPNVVVHILSFDFLGKFVGDIFSRVLISFQLEAPH